MALIKPLPILRLTRTSNIKPISKPCLRSPILFHRSSGSTSFVYNQSRTSSTVPSHTEPPLAPNCEFSPLSYHIYRTPSQELPVYHLKKRGGNLLQTQVRKIEGDLRALQEELHGALGVNTKDIRINHVTGHIIIKGWHKDAVKHFFVERHF